jgi:hypothetical protein
LRHTVGADLVVLATALALAASGCASGGSTTPRAGKGPPTSLIPGWKVETLHGDQFVALVLRNGKAIEGHYRGLAEVGEKDYFRRYARSQADAQAEIALPNLGPGLRVVSDSGAEEVWHLVGFEPGHLKLRPQSGAGATSVGFDRITRVTDSDDHSAEATALAGLATAGRLPFLQEIRIESQGTERRVPLETVSQIEIGRSEGSGWKALIGVVAAAAVVAIVVAVTHNGESKPAPPPPQGRLACSPLVSSYDGERFVEDADIFGGALHRRAKRADWSRLDHLQPVAGRYRLKIEKTHAETEYVDELALLAVDHPPGSRVVPDATGALHLLSTPERPLRATAFDGSDATTLVGQADGRIWISNPFGRDPRAPDQVRDGLTLEFVRPAGARAVTLALEVENTGWAFHLRHEFLGLLGRDVERWYAQMDGSAQSFRAFESARQREIALKVYLWEGEAWTIAGFVGEVGSAIPKVLALPIDLGAARGEHLRLRLESTVGLWTVDEVQADYAAAAPARVVEIRPASVTDEAGHDVTSALLASDDRSYEMTDASPSAVALFEAPPDPAPGLTRTLVLRSNGHYKIHVHGEGEPQWSLVERLVEEPGAFGRYALELLNGRQRSALAQAAGGV